MAGFMGLAIKTEWFDLELNESKSPMSQKEINFLGISCGNQSHSRSDEINTNEN